MDPRKSLFVALIAAGTTVSAFTAHAQFANVFVPELAAMDNALCRPRGGSPYPLVRLAQAGTKSLRRNPRSAPPHRPPPRA